MDRIYRFSLLLLSVVIISSIAVGSYTQDKQSIALLEQPAPKLDYLITYSKDNLQAETLTSLKGKVTLLFFWSPANWESLSLISELNGLYKDYRDLGLEIIGCQSPGYQFEIDNGETESNIRSYQISFPVIIDNGWKTYRAYKNKTWPVIYLTDRNGIIKEVFTEKVDYQKLKAALKNLLDQPEI